MIKEKEDIGQIMHGFSEQNIIKNEDLIYQNVVNFPKISLLKRATMLLVNKVKEFQVQGNRVLLQTEGVYIDEKYTYRYFDYRQVFVPKSNVTNIAVQLIFTDNHTVRLTASEGFTVPENKTPMITDLKCEKISLSIEEKEKNLIISNGTITAHIQKEPWNLSLSNEKGKIYYRQFGRDDHSFMPYEVCPFGFLYDAASGEQYACDAVVLDSYEHFYGLGENFSSIDHKGRAFELWNTNALGVNTDRRYKNIPYYISSNGYGVFYNTSRKIRCDLGKTLSKANSIMIEGSLIDMFIMQGDSIKELLPLYLKISGQPALPPKWSFGLWVSKISYGTRNEVETVTKRMRQMDIPCDVVHIDTDWFAENWICDWKFDENKFPDVDIMIKNLHKDGYKVSLWQLPYIERGNISYEVYDKAMEKGYFASCEDGSMHFPHGLIDFSNPEAVKWFKNDLIKPLLRKGIDVIKVDFGESAPPFFKYANANGKDMHNLYALLYNRAVYEAAKEELGEEQAMIWARSAWAGSQKYPVHWGGDAGTDFGSLESSVKGCLSIGMSGFPFWSSDIGGFWFETNPTLYIRWAQYGMFCSHARLHGFYTREPWDYGEETCNIFRKYVKLRYSLMPYIYSQAVKAVHEGLPMHRALVVDYFEDETVKTIDTQYMFGESILVVPVLNEEGVVKVYLPKGTWTDFHTDTQYLGNQWLNFIADIQTLPLYIKENAVIPMGPAMNYIDEKETDPYFLHLYPIKGKNSFTIAEEAIDIHMKATEEYVRVSISPCNHNFKIVLHNFIGKKVQIDNKSIEVTSNGNNTIIQIGSEQAKEGSIITVVK